MPRRSTTETLERQAAKDGQLGDLDENGLDIADFPDLPKSHEQVLADLDARDERLNAPPKSTHSRERSVPMDARETLQALARGRLFDEQRRVKSRWLTRQIARSNNDLATPTLTDEQRHRARMRLNRWCTVRAKLQPVPPMKGQLDVDKPRRWMEAA